MKYISKIAMLAAAALCAWSCEIEFDKQQLSTPDKYAASSMNAPSELVIVDDNLAKESTFSWTAADFGAPTQIQYTLIAQNGDKTGTIGVTYETTYSIKNEDLNGILLNDLGLTPAQKSQISVFVEACVYSVYGSLSGDPIRSNSASFAVTPYLPALTCVYLPGVASKWDFTCMAWENAAGSQTYTAIVDLGTYDQFKVTDAPDWNHGNWGREYFTGTNKGVTDDGGNIKVSSMDNTIKMITVYPKKSKPRVEVTEPYTFISAIGTIGGSSWNADFDFTYDRANDVWKTEPIAFTASSEYKIRMNHGWSESYGGATKVSNYVQGGYEIEGGNNVKPGIAGSYVIKLYLNRTPWVVVYEKQ